MPPTLRSLAKSPGFTTVALVTIALGIGACTAIFSVVNGVLLRPLDYPEPDRIVMIKSTWIPRFPEFAISVPDYLDWERQSKSFAGMAATVNTALNLTGDGEPQRAVGLRATARYFEVYGVKPALGRTFSPEEEAPGKNKVVVLSQAFWQRALGGNPAIVGRPIQLNGEAHDVIGVMPPGFGAANRIDAWMPMGFPPEQLTDGARGSHFLAVTARLKPGVSPEQADAELKLICAQIAEKYPDTNKGWSAFVMPLLDYSVRNVHRTLYVLLGAVGCVLLIACANIANLLLARATARHRELSIRAALGASRGRIVRQLLLESLVLALAGGTLGVLLARWGLDALLALAPSLPRTSEVRLDAGVLAVSFGLSLVTGLVFGLAPALLTSRVDVTEALKQGGRGTTDGRARSRLRGVLVVIEVAFAVVLLAGAGLLVRSFITLARVDPGFSPENATVLRLALPQKKYGKADQQRAFADALLTRVRALPGVESAGLTQPLPIAGDWVASFQIEGRPDTEGNNSPSANFYMVTPDYFRAMGIRLAHGRLFTEQDDAQAPKVALINEALARRIFLDQDPVGHRIRINGGWCEIAGVVANVTHYGLGTPATMQTYVPFAQRPTTDLNFVIRHRASAAPALATLRSTVYAIDKDQPVGAILPLEKLLADSIARQRFGGLLLTIFSLVALIIAAVGIYGVMAYTVSQRTGEIGIRMALGASPGNVLRDVLGRGLRVVALGLAVGLGATFALGQLVESLLYNTSPRDPLTLAVIAAVLAVTAFVACLLPALRATRVDPMAALRAE